MVNLLLALLAIPNPATSTDVEYSGFPSIADPSIEVMAQDVKVTISGQTATVESLTMFRNVGTMAAHDTLNIPRYRQSSGSPSAPDFNVTATWDKAPLDLTMGPISDATPTDLMSAPMTAAVDLAPDTTFSLRVSYQVPIGITGYGRKQRIVSYQMPIPSAGGKRPIPEVNIAFAFDHEDVFTIPVLKPRGDWQVSRTGAFEKLVNYSTKGQLISMTYYPNGFK